MMYNDTLYYDILSLHSNNYIFKTNETSHKKVVKL